MKKKIALAALVVVLVPLGACSGGGSSSSTTSPSAPGTSISNVIPSSANPAASLPAGWPSDIPAPEGFTIVSSTNHTTAGKVSMSVTYQGSGAVARVNDTLSAELTKAGYTRNSFIDGAAKVSNWTKTNNRVGMTVAQNANQATTVVQTYTPGT